MQAAETETVLSRKARAARHAAASRGASLETAFGRALARTAEEAWNLALVARQIRHLRRDQARAADLLAEGDGLLVLLEGPGGRLGAAWLDRSVAAALVEIQTLGELREAAPEPRRFTPTDAALAAPLLDGVLARLDRALDQSPGGPAARAALAGFTAGPLIEEARIAANLMVAAHYTELSAELDLGGGLRLGHLRLLVPEPPRPEPAPPAAPEGAPRHAEWLMTVTAQIDTVLARISMPYSAVAALRPGDLLDLPAQAVAGTELLAGNRVRVARGRLGQINGQRAVRIVSTAAEPGPAAAPPAASGPPFAPAAAPGTGREEGGAPPPATGESDPRAVPRTAALLDEEGEEDLPDVPPLDFPGDDDTSDGGALELPDYDPERPRPE
ncbi:FliM/FliN family flagellar motor switch protein [Roseivivax sp. CAU 1761]